MRGAAAAMLIQGSAHIYCKKVDHLYELLYKLGSKDDPKKRKQQREGEERIRAACASSQMGALVASFVAARARRLQTP